MSRALTGYVRPWQLREFTRETYKRAAEETRAGDNQETINLKSKESDQ